MKKQFKLFLLPIAFIFLLSACSVSLNKIPNSVVGNNGNQNNGGKIVKTNTGLKSVDEILDNQSKIKKFESPEELKEFLEDTQSGSGGMYSRGLIMDDMVLENSIQTTTGLGAKTVPSAVGKESNSVENDFSKTNVQVEGVDESDIVKTDGEYIYSLTQNELFIIKANPAQDAEIVSKIKFESSPRNIYINGNKLVVFGQDYQVFKAAYSKSFRRRSSYTYFKVFDISDKSKPSQLRDIRFEGSYKNSRMIGDYVYFVTDTYNYYIDGDAFLPRILEDGVEIGCSEDRCIMPDVYYFNIPYRGYNFSSVNVIDLSDLDSDIEREIYILSNSQNMYVSEANIYITYTKYVSEEQLAMEMTKEILLPRLSEKDVEKINAIENVEGFILNDNEKINKVNAIIERYITRLPDKDQEKLEKELKEKMKKKYEDISKELEKTVIHKIAIDGKKIEYKTSGEVTGHILNQFSMDEDGDYFRIATTKNRTWSRFSEERNESYSNLYILDKDLEVVGAIEDLAPGERIYSVRFMQNRAYLVTFKQTDPLFVVDLSSPIKPKVLGELKIPGYSNYLHPYDETTLIGLGKDAGVNEYGGVKTGGLKISLFDVSDVENPKESANVIIGGPGSSSLALNDHKAFLFSRENNLLVIPATLRGEKDDIKVISSVSSPQDPDDIIERKIISPRHRSVDFRGALWFDIQKDKISLRKKISHSNSGASDDRQYWWNGYGYYNASVKRALYINDVLYTISDRYLKMNLLENEEEINKLELKLEKKDDFEIISNK